MPIAVEVHASSGGVEALPVASRKTLFATRRAVRKPVMGAVGARFRMARYARESPTGWEAAVLACVNTGRVVD